MKKILVLLLLMAHVQLFGQAGSDVDVPLSQLSNGVSATSSIIRGVPRKDAGLDGDFFYEGNVFLTGTFLLKDNSVREGFAMRYNLLQQELEVRVNEILMAFDENDIAKFTWQAPTVLTPSTFVSGSDFKLEGTVLKGFLEVLVQGKVLLLKQKQVYVREGYFNPQVGVESAKPKIIKSKKYYLAKDNQLTEISKGKKKLPALFGDKFAQVEQYMDDQKLKASNEEDLIKIVAYYCTLL